MAHPSPVIRHLDLFSGIGGFALAARWCGMQTIGFCEIDPWCQRVLAKNFPGVPIHDDITTLDATTVDGWGGCDVLTGGFPCQPYSVAGKRRGAEDDRALWPEMRRVIYECRPRWVLGENVAGIVKMELDTVLADLEADGYTCWPVVVPAVGVDAPHKRDRVWVIAHTHSDGEPDVAVDGEQRQGKLGQPPVAHRNARQRNESARADSAGVRQSGSGKHEQSIHPAQGGDRKANQPLDGGEGSTWLPEPMLDRVVDGLPEELDRIAGLGNAIVPQVAYEIMRSMS